LLVFVVVFVPLPEAAPVSVDSFVPMSRPSAVDRGTLSSQCELGLHLAEQWLDLLPHSLLCFPLSG
jgi:hypothetical protein